jgi:hypothetical protein
VSIDILHKLQLRPCIGADTYLYIGVVYYEIHKQPLCRSYSFVLISERIRGGGQNSIRTEDDVEEFIKTLTEALASGKISKMSKLHQADLFAKLGLAKRKLQAEIDKQN